MIKEGVMLGGRYEIMGRIGTGGMADVYKVADRVLNRYVAVKVLKREFREDENFVNKFRTEAQSAAGLLHPNIVTVYDVAEDRGLHYIVMELVEGITLKEYIQKKGKLASKEVIGITMQVCAGIDAAHAKNIVHRDIKPQNIMISKEGKVKVTDFGIAKATSSNTISTNAMGSVHYTSPEQARGGFSDAKSDIYSLGITMYEMVTGQVPFDGDTTVSIALKHLQEDITPPSEHVPDIPYSLEQIILKCTQKSADRRYVDIAALARDLKRSNQDPDGDFVKISPLISVADTRMMTEEELEHIQSSTKFDSDYDDEYDEDYYDEDEERGGRRRKQKSDVDPKMSKVMKIMAIVAAVIFILVLLLVVGNVAGIFSGGPGIAESQKKAVPPLVGLSKEEAEEACEDAGFKLKIVDRELSKEYEENYIIRQKTQEGAELPEGATIQVIASSGKLLEIPDVTEKDYIEARDTIIDAGFTKKKIKIQEEPSSEVEIDKVIRTEPEAGEFKVKDTEIIIYVSTGVEMVEVPNLVGKTKEEAEKALTDVGLVGEATEEYNSEVIKGEVISQEEDEGDELEIGSTVKYVVSAGEEPKEQVTIPTDLTGKSFTSVRARLENMGLVVKKVSQESYEYKDGEVISVPASGESVEKGSTVEVYVSVGPGPSATTPGDDSSDGNDDNNPSTGQ